MKKANGRGHGIKIQSGIPMPTRKTNGFTGVLREMKVGDSFETDNQDVRANIYTLALKIGVKVSIHKTDAGTFRVWRTA